MVCVAGFEPAVSRPQTERLSKLAYTQIWLRCKDSDLNLLIQNQLSYLLDDTALVTGVGFEPTFTASKAGVLPIRRSCNGGRERIRTFNLSVKSRMHSTVLLRARNWYLR